MMSQNCFISIETAELTEKKRAIPDVNSHSRALCIISQASFI
uniref:Uncharacterized protein n=1 Tax=Anguilla anguilla TaxID=7936 RepID=A0A0E9WMI6_ANGAN